MANVSSKPAVVTKAMRAPLRSSSALVATVVPWRTSISVAPVRLAICSMALRIARAGSAGVEGSLSTSRLPAAAIDAIGERAACIDGDGEALGHFTANISGAGCIAGVLSLRFLVPSLTLFHKSR